MWLSRILGGLGRVLVTAGALILLFVAYQLWGTNIHTARAQSSLTSEFEDVLATVPSTTAPATTAPATTAPGDPGQVAVVPAVSRPIAFPVTLIPCVSSPSTVSVYDLAANTRLLSVNLTMDVRNAIHGLAVWPYD